MTLDGPVHFVVRALQSPPSLDGAFRIHVLPEHLEQVRLDHGSLCEITANDDNATLLGYGIAWRATDKMGISPRVRPAKTSLTLRDAFSIQEGSQINIARTTGSIVRADKIVLNEVTPLDYSAGNEAEMEDEKWQTRCKYLLVNCEAFASGIAFDVSAKKTIKKRFYIEHVEAVGLQPNTPNLFYCNDRTHVVFADPTASRPCSALNGEFDDILSTDRIGGLVQQLQLLNKRMKRVLKGTQARSKRPINAPVLIHGYEGTGKSLLLEQIERAGFPKILRLDKSKLNAGAVAKNKTVIENVFRCALERQPCLLLMDDLNKIAPMTDDVYGDTIVAGFDQIVGSRVLVIATCRQPKELKSELVHDGRLSVQIELPIPDTQARADVLKAILDNDDDPNGRIARAMSVRTHGFTGKDLALLVNIAYNNADDRYEEDFEHLIRSGSPKSTLEHLFDGAAHSQAAARVEDEEKAAGGQSNIKEHVVQVKMEDFDFALTQVRPTALRELFFERPQIQWHDIGGSQAIKQRFDEIVGWPLQIPEKMVQLRMRPDKGVLLYGPPGCSKTLTAQAVATNYDLNFIAIKGAEVINMYVGESERSIRELFRKARAAAPCIIFFDEIDSIASERESAGTKGLNVLTTLLNEMDGFQSLEGVLVLAATNMPEVLDPAIMRPGRFDTHIYLGPPDKVARKEIFAIQTLGVLEDDVDLDEIVEKAEGYSGSEIVNGICALAKKAALRRVETDGSTSSTNICMTDLRNGLKGTKKGITQEMLRQYAAFAAKASDL